MLQPAQEPVRLGQPAGVVAVDVARRRQLGQRREGRGGAHVGVEPAVDELQQLHGELDVAEAAPAALHLTVGEALAGQLRLDPCLHVAQRAQVVGAEHAVPQVVVGAGVELGAEVGVTGDGAGLQQRLELPRLGPAAPVRLVRGHRAHERAVAALGAEVGVDPEAAPRHVHGPPRPAFERRRIAVADEHHVDVAGVVELAAAELAHADDGQAVRRWRRRQGDGVLHHVGGEGGDGLDGAAELVPPEQVACRDAQVLELLPAGQRVGAVAVDDRAVGQIGEHVEGAGIHLHLPRQLAAGGGDGDHGGREPRLVQARRRLRMELEETLDRQPRRRRRGRAIDGVGEVEQRHAASVPSRVHWWERSEAASEVCHGRSRRHRRGRRRGWDRPRRLQLHQGRRLAGPGAHHDG